MTARNGQAPGYALDLFSPVSHVAASLDKASPGALSRRVMADNYRHNNPGDLARVRQHEGCNSDREATQWLIDRAITELGTQVVINPDDTVQLAEGKTLRGMRYKRKRIYAVINNHAHLGDPFNPMSGRFSENIRTRASLRDDNMEELRESLKSFGWVPEFPAIKDRRGVVLVGHRRLKAAEELGIEPVIKTLFDLGDGDEHDARRLRIAIASNVGFKPLTPTDRKSIAESLYLDGWTLTEIGEVCNVSAMTISRDLKGFNKELYRARGGRPSDAAKKREDDDLDALVEPLMKQGLNRTQIGAELTNSKSGQSPKIAASWARITARWEQEERQQQEQEEEAPDTVTCTCQNCGHVHHPPV
jgi:ParB-like chromosome segregation protein Spo0J